MPRCCDVAALVLGLHVEVDRMTAAVGHVLAGDHAGEPLGVANEVELAELAVKLPEPAGIAHPIRAEVDQPCLTHPSVVESRRISRAPGERRGPNGPVASHLGR